MLFGTPPTVSDRFENLIGLLLTIIALSFSMAESVPKVPYHTFLDKFMYQSVYVLIIMGGKRCTYDFCRLELMGESKAETSDFVCG